MSEYGISREELLEKIAEFRLLDDTYMTAFFQWSPGISRACSAHNTE